MELILELAGDGLPAREQQMLKTFTHTGGLIGRCGECDWVIVDPDNHVSSQHAKITFSEGEFYLVDLSTNGTEVIVAGQQHRLARGVPHRVEHGSRYRVGRFDICARVNELQYRHSVAMGFSCVAPRITPDESFIELDLLQDAAHSFDEGLGLDELLPTYASQRASAQGVAYGPADHQHLLVPGLVAEQAPAVQAETLPRQLPSDDFWQRFGAALGVDFSGADEHQREMLALDAAELLKQCIDSLQQTLRTRSELKNELRLNSSMPGHAGGNPIRLSP